MLFGGRMINGGRKLGRLWASRVAGHLQRHQREAEPGMMGPEIEHRRDALRAGRDISGLHSFSTCCGIAGSVVVL
jgi:hypothetical protein